MLYKPSNMLPSAFGGLGSEIIDASVENTFSMTVNGNAFVGAYQLIIYENTETSTVVYDTGVVELSDLFAPTLPSGRKQSFTVTVPTNNPASTPHTHMVNDYANAYKWTISLWETYTVGTPALTKITSDENIVVARTPATLEIDTSTVNLLDLSDPDFNDTGYLTTGGAIFSNAAYCTSGYIPCENGDVVRYPRDPSLGGLNQLYLFDANCTYLSTLSLGSITDNLYVTKTISQVGTKFLRVSAADTLKASAMVTVNNPYPAIFVPYGLTYATITSRYNQWKATLTSISPVMQFKWRLYEVVDGVNELIYDTGWIFQAPQIWFEYSGLVSGKTYAVQAEAITQDGVTYTTSLATSNVLYDSITSSGVTSVEVVDGGIQVGISGIQYIVGSPLITSSGAASTNYSILDNYLSTGEKALQIGADTYVRFASSETFDLDLTDGMPIVIGLYVPAYSGANVTLAEITSEDAVKSRVLKHTGFQVGVIPDGDSLVPNSDSLAPSAGTNGTFQYATGGVTYSLANSTLPLYRYIVILRTTSFAIYEYLNGGV